MPTYLFLAADPKVSIYAIVKYIKSRTSRLLRDVFSELKKRLLTLAKHTQFLSIVDISRLGCFSNILPTKKQLT